MQGALSKKPRDRFSLELSLERLLTDLAEATQLIDATERTHAPLEEEFKAAHNRCIALLRGKARPVDRAAYLAALDWRMQTGYECYPTREALKDLSRWRKLVLEEIKDVRAMLEKPARKEVPNTTQVKLL